TYLKGVIGTKPIVKNAWFVKLDWEELGLRETFSTRKLEGYISDYTLVRLPGESKDQLLALVWVKNPGFGGAFGGFQSVLALYNL
ncbi:MAG: hypothetical protein JNK65_09785, partial [Deltaproteobacteria bacterium]|nr:hypothetical protein [Deltaproteobacteria bacterium]